MEFSKLYMMLIELNSGGNKAENFMNIKKYFSNNSIFFLPAKVNSNECQIFDA